MMHVLQQILEKALARLSQHLTTFVPPLIVGGAILAFAWLLAILARWLIVKAIKGAALDKFLKESGLGSIVDRSGRLRAASLVAGAAYWAIVAVGFLTALDAFDTRLTSRIVETTVFAVPTLLTAGAILLAGFWLAQYLGRTALIWAVNEGMPLARRMATAVRIVILFVAVVVAADTLDFGGRVFFTAFVIVLAAAAFSISLAVGLSLRVSLERYFAQHRTGEGAGERERSLWNHL